MKFLPTILPLVTVVVAAVAVVVVAAVASSIHGSATNGNRLFSLIKSAKKAKNPSFQAIQSISNLWEDYNKNNLI